MPEPKATSKDLLDLARRARHAEDALSLQFILCNETYSLAPYTLGVLWIDGEGVIAQSGVSQVERNSAFNLWIAAICETLAKTQKITVRVFPEMLSETDAREWSNSLASCALWVPSVETAGPSLGFLIIREEQWTDYELGLLNEWMDIWQHAWQKLQAPSARGELTKYWLLVWSFLPQREQLLVFSRDVLRGARAVRSDPKIISRSIGSVFFEVRRVLGWVKDRGVMGLRTEAIQFARAVWEDKKRRYVWIFWILVLFPVRLTVLVPGELVPANPAVIRVPIEGVVDEFFVKPNERVVEGQLLFRLDLTSLTSRLLVAQQETQIASTELRQSTLQSLTDSKSRRLLIPQEGKAAERKLEADYLRELLEKAQIKAPKAGVALFDDPSDWMGKPVVAGEKVMVVASEGAVEIEAWIPIADAIELSERAPVTLYLNATPLSPVSGAMRYVGHEAIARPDGSYAYRLRATLDPGESSRRVGLKGTARISGSYVPFSYWILRKPLAWLRQFLGL